MRRSYLLILLCFPIFIGLNGCTLAPNFWTDAKPGQKKVLVTFPPLYSITHAVGGDDVYVLCMLTTSGPHGYQGAPTDLFMVNKADLLLYNGLSLDEDFVDKMLHNHMNPKLVTLNIGETLRHEQPKLLLKGDGKWHLLPDGQKHKHGDHDPHLWLGPPQAIEMTKLVAAKLADLDPARADGYQRRSAKYIDDLKDLQAHGTAALKGKKNKKIITMHEAFGYFAKAFGVEIVASIQLQPGVDPDAKTLAELIKHCRATDGPRVIAIERQYSGAPAEALADSLKREGIRVEIITLDPLETADVANGQKFNPDPGHYLKTMRENIDTLAKALP